MTNDELKMLADLVKNCSSCKHYGFTGEICGMCSRCAVHLSTLPWDLCEFWEKQ